MHKHSLPVSILLSMTTATGLFFLMLSFGVVQSHTAATYLNFSSANYTLDEANGTGTITVTLDAQVPETVTVEFESYDLTAQAGIDYIQTSGTLTFTPGITNETFNIEIIDNELDTHPYLQAGLYITNPVGALLGPTKTTSLTIIDDELSYVFLPINLNHYPSPPVPSDLLLNSGFEEGFTHDTFDGSWLYNVLTPRHWISWWEDEPSSVQYPMHAPEVRPIPNEGIYYSPIPRIRSGYYAIQMFRTWGRYRAGFYQQVQNLNSDTRVYFSYHAHAWSCGDDPPPALSCGDPYAFYFQAGIDPTGGTDPWSDNIVWSDSFYFYDSYGEVGPVQASVGDEGKITVYILAHALYAVKFNDAYFDDAVLAIQQP